MRLFLACCAVALSTSAFAQSRALTEVSLGLGTHTDRIENISLDWMRAYSLDDEIFNVDLDKYEYSPYSELWAATLNVDFTFGGDQINSRGVSRELRVGTRMLFDREAMVSYDFEEAIDQGTYREHLVFCLVDNEIAGDATVIWRKQGKRFSIYSGVGAVLGTTFNSELLRIRNAAMYTNEDIPELADVEEIESITESFASKNSGFARVQVPVGVQVHAGPLAIGLELRLGAGAHTVYGGKSYFISSANSFAARMSYFPFLRKDRLGND